MKTARLLIGLLVLATVLVDLVVWSAVVAQQAFAPRLPQESLMLFYSLALSQISLLAIWAGLGGVSFPWRLNAVAVAIGVWTHILTEAVPVRADRDSLAVVFLCIFWAGATAILILVLGARWAGFAIVSSCNPVSSIVTLRRQPVQFSLACLLSWLTAVAVFLSLAKFGVSTQAILENLDAHVGRGVAITVLVTTTLAIVALWTALSEGRTRYLVLCLVLVTVAVTMILIALGRLELCNSIVFCLLQLALLLSSLAVCRVAGYRIVRRGAAASTAKGADETAA